MDANLTVRKLIKNLLLPRPPCTWHFRVRSMEKGLSESVSLLIKGGYAELFHLGTEYALKGIIMSALWLPT